MVQGTVKVQGSLHFRGKVNGGMAEIFLLCISTETFLPILTCSFPFSFLLRVHKSFKDFAYFGIYLMASKMVMLTSTLLKVSKRLESSSTFFAVEGKGRIIYFGAEFVFRPASIGFGSSLPLLRVIALAFPFGLIIGCAGILLEPCCCNWLTIVANCPI